MDRFIDGRDAGPRGGGFTLLEIAVALAVSAVILVPTLALLFQFMALPTERVDATNLVRTTRQAVRWIGADARQSESFTPQPAPDYGTFAWTDRVAGGAPASHAVRYYWSAADRRLMREETVDGGAPEAFPVARDIAAHGDVSIGETGGLVQASVTASRESVRGPLSRTADVRVHMRPVLPPGAAPTPPPITLAMDDFESGGFGGGDGWLGDWFSSGDASVVTAGAPYEGAYHLRLRRGNGYADRSLDLAGQTDVRLQFWAKADSFEPGQTATLSVSPDGASFTVVRAWVDGVDDDDVWRFEDIDLSGLTMSGEFFIAFDAEMSGTGDRLYVDDLRVVRSWS